jgi:hypothetical protein
MTPLAPRWKGETMSSLPTVHDGFDDDDDDRDRVIQGILIKYAEGVWKANGSPIADGLHLVAMTAFKVVQRWANKKPVETIFEEPRKPLPDVAALNLKVPRKEWEPDFNNQPQPPWVVTRLVYLINPDTGAKYTFSTRSIGGAICVRDLQSQVRAIRRIRGSDVCPLVGFGTAAMKTRYGVKQRPAFCVASWCAFGASKPAAIADQTNIAKVEPPAEEDDPPFQVEEPAKASKKTGKK